MDAAALLADLEAAQREAVTSDGAPLCILAPAGSGKTRVLTRRIAHRCATGSADPRRVLVLTFTRKAAAELRARLHHLGVRDQVTAGTFHAVAFAQLRRRWADAGRRAPTVVDRRRGLIARALERAGGTATAPGHVAAVAAEIDWAKARGLAPHEYPAAARAARRRPGPAADEVAAAFTAYEQEKRRRGVLDFDDLLLECLGGLEDDSVFAAAQRWRFRHLFVDELQDVNPLQFRLLEAWRGGRPDLCVVGDPNQAIYGWNGAEPALLREIDRHLPGVRTVRLAVNFRSSAAILAAADAALGPARHGPPPHASPSTAQGPPPEITGHRSEQAEAEAVARHIRRAAAGGRPWSQIAVLARTNAQLDVLATTLAAAGIPVVRRSTPGRRNALSGGPFAAAVAELTALPAAVPLSSAVRDLVAEARNDPAGVVRLDAVDEVAELAGEYLTADPDGDAAGFAAWLAAAGSDPADRPGAPAVTLATFHAAKGLEWPVVFVTGLEDGLLPSARARGAEAVAEERRLLHVALTRAGVELHCSWAETRTFGSRVTARRPSPFLRDIEAAVASSDPLEGPVDWRAHLAEQRRLLRPAAAS